MFLFLSLADCIDKKKQDECIYRKNIGHCSSDSKSYDFMIKNCIKTCGKCQSGKN